MESELTSFETWAADPRNATAERLVWRLPMYRVAVFALHVGGDDALTLSSVAVTTPIAAQLYRALGSIGANIAEGYSRSSGRDRVRLYEYALGSARESVVWYRAASPVLGAVKVAHRQHVLQRLISTLLAVIPAERARRIEKL